MNDSIRRWQVNRLCRTLRLEAANSIITETAAIAEGLSAPAAALAREKGMEGAPSTPPVLPRRIPEWAMSLELESLVQEVRYITYRIAVGVCARAPVCARARARARVCARVC